MNLQNSILHSHSQANTSENFIAYMHISLVQVNAKLKLVF